MTDLEEPIPEDSVGSNPTPTDVEEPIPEDSLGSNPTPIGIRYTDTTLTLSRTECCEKQSKVIVHDCTGQALPGELIAVMGPSGCGKTSLLNMLNGKCHRSTWTGKITVNTHDFDPSNWGDRSVFVEQRDTVLTYYTPRETLTFAAELQQDLSIKDRDALVNRMLEDFDIAHVADTYCGDQTNVKGLSGGQIKRVCICRELMADGMFITMDEPTSGLDFQTALETVQYLRHYCDKYNKTIMMSIHQPGYHLSQLIDRYVFLKDGALVFDGTLDEMNAILPTEEGEPVLDKMQRIICEDDEESLAKIESMKEIAKEKSANLPDESMPSEKIPENMVYETGCCGEFKLLFIREWVLAWRNKATFFIPYILPIGLASITAIPFYQIGQEDFVLAIWATATGVFVPIFSALVSMALAITSEIYLAQKEVESGTYHIYNWYFSKLLKVLVEWFLCGTIAAVIVYYLLAFRMDFSLYWAVFILVGVVTISTGAFFAVVTKVFFTAIALQLAIVFATLFTFGLEAWWAFLIFFHNGAFMILQEAEFLAQEAAGVKPDNPIGGELGGIMELALNNLPGLRATFEQSLIDAHRSDRWAYNDYYWGALGVCIIIFQAIAITVLVCTSRKQYT